MRLPHSEDGLDSIIDNGNNSGLVVVAVRHFHKFSNPKRRSPWTSADTLLTRAT